MSLKVWLPLNGDLKNLGASETEIISNGTTIDINGKIGSCYSFSPDNSSYLRLNTAPFNNNTTEFSFTCWFKPSASHIGCLFSNRSSTTSAGITLWYYNSVFYFDAGDRWSSVSNANAIIGAWNHLAFTWKLNGKKRIYVNGDIIGEENAITALTNATIGTAFIGAAQTVANHDTIPGGSYFNGYLNDVRIYDHCLSAAEVHEIAQGLIMHYKLNDPMNGIGKNYLVNLIDNTNNFKSNGCTYDYKDGTYTLIVTDVGEFQQIWTDNLITDTSNFVGKNIIVSYENITTTDSSADIRVYLRCTNSSSNITSYRINNYATKITLPEDIVKIGILFRCDQNKNSPMDTVATFSKFKLEIGDKATTWIPPEYPYEENNLIIDSSGYGHQANLQTGTSSFTLDTAKYNSSLTTEETTCYRIQDTIFDSQHLASEFTWSGWIKRGYTMAEARYIYKGIVYIYLGDEFDIRIGWRHRNEDGSYDSNNAWAPGIIIPYNEWTHITFTFKDGIMKLYINGEYIRMTDRSETGIYIRGYRNFYFPSNSGDSFVGNISDIRIYCTALLDTDMKLLYNISSRIDNLGEVHSFELNEKQSNLFRSELIAPLAKNDETSGSGEIIEKNNEYCMCIKPRPFYKNLENEESALLKDCFQENTSYIFDMWMDLSEKTAQGNYSTGGFYIYYTDGSRDNTFALSGQEGWQHNKLITPSDKTIERISVRYNNNVSVLYRLDSFICKADNIQIIKSGILNNTNIIERNGIASFSKGGNIYSSEFIEI